MAVVKQLNSTSLVLEIENGTDKAGAPVYRKKSFSGVKGDATAEDAYAVAEAMKSVLANGTRDIYLADTSRLVNA